MQNKCKAKILTEHIRDGLVEQLHSGFVVMKKDDEFIEFGETNGYPFYLRSCAKPLQASLMIDYELDKKLNLTSEEIAIACASHAGEDCHVNTAKSFMYKADLCESYIRCGFHKPLAKSVVCEMPTVFHNNCVGKHILMLALCKEKGYELENYFEKTHPLQIEIRNKIYSLCEYDGDTPVTKDGCGVPIFSMPIKNMLIGFLNLFCDTKYAKIKNAFLDNPYIIGGEDRTDTKIMQLAKGVVAKVGAEGLVIVVKPETKEGFIVKILDSDMKTREFVALNLLNQLGWGNFDLDDEIKTLHGDIVGHKVFSINL